MRGKRWRLERQFGVVVGGVFAALAGWAVWRHGQSFWNGAVLTIGSALVLFGLIWPRALVRPRRAWMALAEALSYVSTRIILGVVFFLIMTPIGFFMRLRGWDPLARQGVGRDSHWLPYSERQRNPKHFEKMY
jgi:hypothetical protein